MRTSTTLLLAVATAALVGGVYLYEQHRPNSREAALRRDYLVLFDRAKIDAITIKGGKSDIRLERSGAQWRMVEPVKDRANPAAVVEVIELAEKLRRESSFQEGELDKRQLKSFGMRKPDLRLKLEGKNAPPEILFGKETAVEGKRYARLEDSNEVSIVSDELAEVISRDADAFRDPRLADVEGQMVDEVSLKLPAGEIALHREINRWELLRPLRARASEERVIDLIGSLLHTEILGFAPEKSAPGTYGLAEPLAVVTLRATSREEPVVLELGGRDEQTGEFYGRLVARNAIVRLPERVGTLLTLRPNDFRERTLAHLDEDVIDRITLQGADKEPLIFDRRGEAWTFREGREGKPQPANVDAVEAMMTALRTREIADFVEDVAADLPRYGLDEPQRRVTFSSYASENTAEALAGEEAIVTIAFGKEEEGRVYARAENEPYIVSMDAAILKLLSPATAPWRTLRVTHFAPEEVTALEVGGVKLDREAEHWKMSSGNGVLSTVNVESLLNTLSSLQGMERLTELPEGVDAETGRVSWTLGSGHRATLILYGSIAEGGCYGALEGESGFFRLSSPDEGALRLPLTQQ